MSNPVLHAMKIAEWERAKGSLRAVAQIQWNYRRAARSAIEEQDENARWEKLNGRIEEFIKNVEWDALHE